MDTTPLRDTSSSSSDDPSPSALASSPQPRIEPRPLHTAPISQFSLLTNPSGPLSQYGVGIVPTSTGPEFNLGWSQVRHAETLFMPSFVLINEPRTHGTAPTPATLSALDAQLLAWAGPNARTAGPVSTHSPARRAICFPGRSTPTPDRIPRGSLFYMQSQRDSAPLYDYANICGPVALCNAAGYDLTNWAEFSTFIATHMPGSLPGIWQGSTDDQLLRFGQHLGLRDMQSMALYGTGATNIRTTSDGFQIPNASIDDFVQRVGQRFVLSEGRHWTSYRQFADGQWSQLDGLDGSERLVGDSQSLRQHLQARLDRQTARGPGFGISMLWWQQQPSPSFALFNTQQYELPAYAKPAAMRDVRYQLPTETVVNILEHVTGTEVVAATQQAQPGLAAAQGDTLKECVLYLETERHALLELLRACPDTATPPSDSHDMLPRTQAALLPSREDLIFTARGLSRNHPEWSRWAYMLSSTSSHERAGQALNWLEQRIGLTLPMSVESHTLRQEVLRAGLPPDVRSGDVLTALLLRLAESLPSLMRLDMMHIRAGNALSNANSAYARTLRLITSEVGTLSNNDAVNTVLLAVAQSAARVTGFFVSSRSVDWRGPVNPQEINANQTAAASAIQAVLAALNARSQSTTDATMRLNLDVPVLAELARSMPLAARDQAGSNHPHTALSACIDQFVAYVRPVLQDALLTIAKRIDLYGGLVGMLDCGPRGDRRHAEVERLVCETLQAIITGGTPTDIERAIEITLGGLRRPAPSGAATIMLDAVLDWLFPQRAIVSPPLVNPSVPTRLLSDAIGTASLHLPRASMAPYWQQAAQRNQEGQTQQGGHDSLCAALARVVAGASPFLVAEALENMSNPLGMLGAIGRGLDNLGAERGSTLVSLLGSVPEEDRNDVDEDDLSLRTQIPLMVVRYLNSMYSHELENGTQRVAPLDPEHLGETIGMLVAQVQIGEIASADELLGLIRQLQPTGLGAALRGVIARVRTCYGGGADFCVQALTENMNRVPAAALPPLLDDLARSIVDTDAIEQRDAFVQVFVAQLQRLGSNGFNEVHEQVRASFRSAMMGLVGESAADAYAQIRLIGTHLYRLPAQMRRDWFDAAVAVSNAFVRDWSATRRETIALLMAGYLNAVDDAATRNLLASSINASFQTQSAAQVLLMPALTRNDISMLMQALSEPQLRGYNEVRIANNLLALRSSLTALDPSRQAETISDLVYLARSLRPEDTTVGEVWFEAAAHLLRTTEHEFVDLSHSDATTIAASMGRYLGHINDANERARLFLTIPSTWQQVVAANTRRHGA